MFEPAKFAGTGPGGDEGGLFEASEVAGVDEDGVHPGDAAELFGALDREEIDHVAARHEFAGGGGIGAGVAGVGAEYPVAGDAAGGLDLDAHAGDVAVCVEGAEPVVDAVGVEHLEGKAPFVDVAATYFADRAFALACDHF